MAFTDAVDLESYLCVLCKEYLLETPRQAPCGERICSPCWRERKERFARSVVYNVAIAAYSFS